LTAAPSDPVLLSPVIEQWKRYRILAGRQLAFAGTSRLLGDIKGRVESRGLD
jgi:hypothetical protein